MRILGSVLLAVVSGAFFVIVPAWAQTTPTCPPLEGQVTVGLQGYHFTGDRDFLRQYRSFPEGGFRGNLTDVEIYACPDPDKDQKIEFLRRNPHRLVESNSLSFNLEDFAFRVQLWRYRHRPLEVFPAPTSVGTAFGSAFTSDVPPNAFFRTSRTRFDVEGRVKGKAFGDHSHVQGIWVRFRNEQRDGLDQFRFVLGGADRVSGFDNIRWRQEALSVAADINEVSAGIALGRPRNYALAFLFFLDRYSSEAPLTTNATIAPFGGVTPTGATKIRTDGTLGLRTFDFIPDSRTLQSAVQFLKGWKEDRHLLFAAYSFSRLSQERLTPLEGIFAAGYHGQLDTHLLLVSPIFQVAKKATLRVFFRDEIRENDSSFGPGQFLNPAANLAAPRLDRLTRMRYGAELNYRPGRAGSSFTVETSQRHTERDLTFGVAPGEFIAPGVTLLRRDTDITTLRVEGRVRPTKNSSLRGEYRFQTAQNTGLPIEPNRAHRFDFESSYDFTRRNVYGGLSFHFQENRESNDTHFFTGLVGSTPQTPLGQDFVNNNRYLDATLWLAPGTTPLTFTVSFHRFEDDSQQNFFFTNRRRFETAAGVLFTLQERTPYENTTHMGSVGINYQLSDSWAAHSNYVISKSNGNFSGSGSLTSTLRPFSRVDNRIQAALVGLSFFAPRKFTLQFEYAHENYDDRVQPTTSGNLNSFSFSIRKAF